MRQQNEISRSLKIYYPGFRVKPERFHATLYAALLTISDAPLPVFAGQQKEIRKTHLGKEYSICTAARPLFRKKKPSFYWMNI